MKRPVRVPVWLAPMALLLTLMAIAPAHAAPKPRPDLVVSSLKLSTSAAPTGSRLTITVKTTNKGKANAPKSTTRLLLSKTTKGGRTLVNVPAPALKKGKSATVSRTVTVPNTTGAWRVIAVADAAGKVRESSERNNTRNTNLRITTPAPAPVPQPGPAPLPAPGPTPNPAPVPTPSPSPSPTPGPGGWPAGLTVEVSLPAGPVELAPGERALDVVVRASNGGTAASPAVSGALRGGISAAPQGWWPDASPVSIPALAPGGQAEVPVRFTLPIGDDADDFTETLYTRFEHSGYQSPVRSVELSFLGTGEVDVILSAVVVGLPDQITVGSEGAGHEVTVVVSNAGTKASAPHEALLRYGFDFTPAGWSAPANEGIEIPAVPAGGEFRLTVPLSFAPYTGETRAETTFYAELYPWMYDYASPIASADARFAPPLDGRNLAITDAELPTVIGASATRPQAVRAKARVGNVGTQAAGDRVYATAAILQTPAWDASAAGASSHVAWTDALPTGTSQWFDFSLTWNGPVPAEPRYLVVCVNAVPDQWWGGEYWPIEQTTTADDCAVQELSFVDLDAPMTPAEGPSGMFPQTPAPASVSVTPAEEPAFTAPFSWQQTSNQTWTLTAGTGVEALVAVPHGVFIEDFDLTGTPVTLTDLPIDSVLGAFELAPGDLLGYGPLTVRFTLTGAANPDDQVVFTADSDGSNFRLAPIVPNAAGGYSATVVTAALDHLGIIGIGTATPAQREALTAAWPTHDDQQLEHAAATASHGIRRDALADGARARAMAADDDWNAWLLARATAWWNDKVIPAFDAASAPTATEVQMQNAVQTFLGFDRVVQLAGVDEYAPYSGWLAEGRARMFDIIERYADRVKNRCLAGQVDAVPDMLATMRQLQLMGMEAKSNELDAALPTCMRYRLVIDLTYAYPLQPGSQQIELHQGWTRSLSESGNHNGVFLNVVNWTRNGNPYSPSFPIRADHWLSSDVKPNKRRGVGSTLEFTIQFNQIVRSTEPLNYAIFYDKPSPFSTGDVGELTPPPVKIRGRSYQWTHSRPVYGDSGTIEILIQDVAPSSG